MRRAGGQLPLGGSVKILSVFVLLLSCGSEPTNAAYCDRVDDGVDLSDVCPDCSV